MVEDSTLLGESITKDLEVTGVSTFGDGSGTDLVDINADVDMNLNLHLTGLSTFTGLIDANGGINVTTKDRRFNR